MPSRVSPERLRYLTLLSEQYPNIPSASTEVINLQATLNLPKGTEHFLSDVHGEYASFLHVLHNASGVIKEYIEELFGNHLRESEKSQLATLIYYPDLKLESMAQEEENLPEWYKITLLRLVLVLKRVSSKYTRSAVRHALPEAYAFIIEELLHEGFGSMHKAAYYEEIIDRIVLLNRAPAFIVAIAGVIHRLAIDRLHVIGDLYDRGPDSDKILDLLQDYHAVDVQWGNHDICWMGAALGCEALVCNALRISARYDNLHTIEDGYGINLVPLATLALQAYADCDCDAFLPEVAVNTETRREELRLVARMQLAVTVLQLKAEAAIIRRNPRFEMENRLLLSQVNYAENTIKIDGVRYPLNVKAFPTIDPADPFAMTPQEEYVLKKLTDAFVGSAKLRAHAQFLLSNGSIYLVCNGNLLYHGCIPMTQERTLKPIAFFEGEDALRGRALLDRIETAVREGAYAPYGSLKRRASLDVMWYLWCGAHSPLFGKDRLALFERSFLSESFLWHEDMNPYYRFRNERKVCEAILLEFGLDPDAGCIINGHVPVKVVAGESPIKAEGKLLVIDGGFARAYQPVTGLAGYTLIYNSKGLILAAHDPFDVHDPGTLLSRDIISHTLPVWMSPQRILVRDTDLGREIQAKVADLMDLLQCFYSAQIKER